MRPTFVDAWIILLITLGLMSGAVQAQQRQTSAVNNSEVATDAQLPAGERLYWGQEPVENVSATRGRVVLNGLWKFQPAQATLKEPASHGWGYIRVPGSWRTGYSDINIPRVVAPGNGPMWDTWKNDSLSQGWYERLIHVPAAWQRRAIILNFQRVSTDAWIYVDGKEAGRIGWPGGEVNITSLVQPGQDANLRVFVAASPSSDKVGTFMGPGAGQVSFAEATLPSKGIIDDVLLESRLQEQYISDVFVQPSTRQQQITLDVELAHVQPASQVQFIARMERNGKVEQTFRTTVTVQAAPLQTVKISWPWHNAALWDLDQPNLYTVKLTAQQIFPPTYSPLTPNPLNDEYAQEFGFREFWVEGRKFFLNGKEFRLRPQVMPEQWSGTGGTPEYIDGVLDGMRWVGYNIGEMWPYQAQRRGQHHFHEVFYTEADHKGFPLMGSCGAMNDYMPWGGNDWKSPVARQEFERLTWQEVRRARNHPSILLWSSSGNLFGHAQDQNPREIGRDTVVHTPAEKKHLAVIYDGLNTIKRYDPTRPAFIHQAIAGDVYAVNNYLDFHPLQEREEWLSQWAKDGPKPYLAVEFGTPLDCSYMRGRSDFGGAIASEPWLTEFAAIYYGPEIYRHETPEYRAAMREHFTGEQVYKNWQGDAALDFSPASQMLQQLFVTNTWRSWRATDITGGMVPWSAAHGWEGGTAASVDAPPFQPGRRGTYEPKLSQSLLFYLRPAGGYKLLPAAHALMENDGATLAYIGGEPGTVTDKQHAFWVGQRVSKQAVLINDTRSTQPYAVSWLTRVGDRVIGRGQSHGMIDTAQNLFVPFSFAAPKVSQKTDGMITLTVKIGAVTHNDQYSVRVFPRLPRERGTVLAFDPVGATTKMLKSLGYSVQPWTGESRGGQKAPLLVIGREAFNHIPANATLMPRQLQDFVRNGGRAIIFTQQPDWMRDTWGLRVSRHVTRRVFPINAAHPVVRGLDAQDLRDWAGQSTLVDPYPMPSNWEQEQPYGWHWGNRGGVASAAIEKPHLSGWRPLLECEFDGAYAPLLELDYSAGRLTLCLLDLEEHTLQEPAADRLTRQIINYAQTAPLQPRAAKVALLGNAPDWFSMLGVQCERLDSLPGDAGLVLLAPDAHVAEATLRAYLEKGGKVVFLPRQGAGGTGVLPLGATLVQKTSIGSLEVPTWNAAAGLSPSDLRWRNEASAWLLQGVADPYLQVGAGGQLAMKRVGQGVVVWLQCDPERFDADRLTYFRFTRWRQTRAVAQVLANLGATLRADDFVFTAQRADPNDVSLAGTWQVAYTKLVPGAATPADAIPDPGISDAAQQLVQGKGTANWQPVQAPVMLPAFTAQDGEAVLRREVEVPSGWSGQDLVLELGALDDFDQTFWNGESIGQTNTPPGDAWNLKRTYTVPGRLVRAGKNTLSIRLWDRYGGGGFGARAEEMIVHPAAKPMPRFYHPDYRTDFNLGDDPFRYKRW